MAEVKVSIGGRSYPVMCDDGQEDRVRSLAARIDAEAAAFAGAGASLSEARLLMMSALMIADKLDEAEMRAASAPTPEAEAEAKDLFSGESEDASAAVAEIDELTDRIAALARPIAQAHSAAPAVDSSVGDADEADDGREPEAENRMRMRELRRARRQARREQASGSE